MLWKKCMVRGAVTGLITGLVGTALVAWLGGPSLSLLKLTALTTAAGAVTGLTTLMWLRGAAQVGGRLSAIRAGLVSGLIAGAVVGAGGSLLLGVVSGGLLAAIGSAVVTGVATGALTAAAGVPVGCTVKGWLEAE